MMKDLLSKLIDKEVDVVCTGTAAVTGTASETEFMLSSTTGVVGPSCPAALPVGHAMSDTVSASAA